MAVWWLATVFMPLSIFGTALVVVFAQRLRRRTQWRTACRLHQDLTYLVGLLCALLDFPAAKSLRTAWVRYKLQLIQIKPSGLEPFGYDQEDNPQY